MQEKLEKMGRNSVRVGALAFVLAFTTAIAMPAAASAEDTGSATARIARLESGANTLQRTLDGMSGALSAFLPPRDIAVNDVAPIQVAQSRDAASAAVRLDQLEEQMRTLNGQVQGLQFQLTQMQTLIERMQEDTDARFSALEGGVSPGKTRAASQTGGTAPAGGTPPAVDLSAPTDTTGVGTDTTTGSDPNDKPIDLGAPEQPLGTLTLNDLSGAAATGGNIEIGKNQSLVTDADADAQYKAGYEAVIKGDYAFAEDQFRQFISLFPDHPKAPDATNWLGEALIQRGDYEDAANILLNGFQTYPNSARAPDILMKLGIALVGTGENDTACRTFGEVLKRYPNVTPAFKQRLAQEEKKAKC